MFAYSFLAMTSYNILKPATRSKFISSLGSDNLPYVQLAAGLLIGVLMHLYGRASDRIPRRWLVPLTQAGEVVVLLAFWALFQTGAAWVSVAFYVVGLVLGVLLISQFWTLANDIYDPRQAKRLFGFIGGGASLGGATGAGLTSLAVEHVGTNNLLLVSSLLLAACVAVVAAIARRQESWKTRTPADEAGVGGSEAFRLLRTSPHLQVIALVVASATIGATIIDQQLNMAAEAIKGQSETDAITGFLAEVTFYTSIIGFVVQVALTSQIHRHLGIGFALLMLPLGLGSTALVILFNGALWAPALARLLDASLRYTVDKTTREVLFLPLPSALKHRAKPVIDVTVDRMAKALGALLLLVLIKPWGLGLNWQQLSLASLALMVVWIAVALRARKEYLSSFRQSLGARLMSPGAVHLDVADAATIETLVEELSSPDESSVLYAIDLLESLNRRNLITPLLRHHPSSAVRARALQAIATADAPVRRRWAGAIDAMLADEDADVRSAAVHALAHGAGEDAAQSMGRYLDDPDPRVVVTAATVLSASPRPEDLARAEQALKRLLGATSDEAARARREVAAGFARIQRRELTPLLVGLLQDADPDVVREAIRSARALAGRDPLVVPALVSLLADRVHRRTAREALVSAGPGAVELLAYFLRDTEESRWVRRHLPATLARIGTAPAMDALASVLDDADGFLRFKALEAIESLHRRDATLPVPKDRIERLVQREVLRYANCLALRHNLVRGDREAAHSLITRALDDKMGRILDRIYRLLGLLHSWKDITAARYTIEHGQARARASAIEYLDNVLPAPLRRRVVPMLDDSAPEDRVRFANSLIKSRPRDVEETLVQLVHDDDQVVSAAAVLDAARRQAWSLVDDLEHALKYRPAGDRYVFGAASWVLGKRRTGDARRPATSEPLPTVELVDRVRDIPLFRGVSVDEIFRLVDLARQVGFERGRSLFPSGVLADSVFVLIEGTVIVHEQDGGAREVSAPAAFAVDAVVTDGTIRDAIDAGDRVVGLRISKADFLATVADSSALARAVFGLFLEGAAPSSWATPALPERTESGQLQPLDRVFWLRAHPLFGRASVDQCLQIVALTRDVALSAGTVILGDDLPPAIHLIVNGEVRIEAPDRPAVTLGPGHSVGVAEGLGGRVAGWRAVVTREGRAITFEPADLFALFGEHPDLVRSLLGGVVSGKTTHAQVAIASV